MKIEQSFKGEVTCGLLKKDRRVVYNSLEAVFKEKAKQLPCRYDIFIHDGKKNYPKHHEDAGYALIMLYDKNSRHCLPVNIVGVVENTKENWLNKFNELISVINS